MGEMREEKRRKMKRNKGSTQIIYTGEACDSAGRVLCRVTVYLVACVETRATSDVHATNVRHATTFDSEVGGEIWQSIRCAVLET